MMTIRPFVRRFAQTARLALLTALLLTMLGGASASTPPFEYGDYQQITSTFDGMPPDGVWWLPFMSSDGNLVMFTTNTTNYTSDGKRGYLLYDRRNSMLSRVNIPEEHVSLAKDNRFSGNGRYLLYEKGPDPFTYTVWRHDLQTDTDEHISVNLLGDQPNDGSLVVDISDDGRYTIFASLATDLVENMATCNQLFLRDTATGTTRCVPMGAEQTTPFEVNFPLYANTLFSGDGSTLYYTTDGRKNLYTYNLADGISTHVDLTFDDAPLANAINLTAISMDGSLIAFGQSVATNIVPGISGSHVVYIYDHATGAISAWDAFAQGLVAKPDDADALQNYSAHAVTISPTGRYIWGYLHILTPSDTQAAFSDSDETFINFVYDRQMNTTTPILQGEDQAIIGDKLAIITASGEGDVILFHATVDESIDTDSDLFLGFRQSDDPQPVVTELLVNGNFDDNDNGDPLLPDGWRKVGPLKFDRVKTNTQAQTFAHSAPNAFQLRGTQAEVGVTSRLTRNAKLAGVTFAAGETLTLGAMVDARTGIAGTTVARAVVKYRNGTQQVLALKLPKPAVVGYTPVSVTRALKRADVKAITVELFYNKPTGRLMLDDVSLKHTTIPTTPPAWTPLPAPAG